MDILAEILKAEIRIRSQILKTPLLYSNYLSSLSGGDVYLKLESEQVTGSFKARGSLNKLMWLKESGIDKIAITASTGNHGLGFARALRLLNMEGKIVLPHNAVSSKVDALKSYGAELLFHGDDCFDSEMFAKDYARKHDMVWVSPYNDPQVIGGQGTIAIEAASQVQDIDNVFATVGGGGMISGIATYLDKVSPKTKIYGCQPERSPEMALSVQTGTHQTVEQKETLSDGSAGGFEEDSITFGICNNLIDEFILVSEDEIKSGIRTMLTKHGKLVEGAAGVAIAAFMLKIEHLKNQTSVIVICGSNISIDKLKSIL